MGFFAFAALSGVEMIGKHVTLTESIKELTPIVDGLVDRKSDQEKEKWLWRQPRVADFFEKNAYAKDLMSVRQQNERIVLLSLVAIGEGNLVFYDCSEIDNNDERLDSLLKRLLDVDSFYGAIGGIVGYHLSFLTLLEAGSGGDEAVKTTFECPQSLDISEPGDRFYDLSAEGIAHLAEVAAIFPVGGAGDRLDLHDEETGLPLPAGKLMFMGRSLLNGMFRDLQGLEYLYETITGKALTIPVAMMTSVEKQNDRHIRDICDKNGWFGRDRGTVAIFKQPMAPVITEEGRWSFLAPLHLNMKPGGHGVIWKLAIDEGVFSHLKKQGISKTILRQVNNPLAALDGNLLTLIGQGFRQNAKFGFMTCQRPVHISEGMVVLERGRQGEMCLKNVEYTDFVKRGISDQPSEPGSLYSLYPSNTNILFADLSSVEAAVEDDPLPGKLLNLKAKFPTMDEKGVVTECYGGRLETVMQNVADHFSFNEGDPFPAFSLYNRRQKVHSTTKRTFQEGVTLDQTPVKSFYDLQCTLRELLSKECGIDVPDIESFDDFLEFGPRIVADFHPALGPLFHIIGQKIRGGEIAAGSELLLEIAACDVESLSLDGSLRVFSDRRSPKNEGRLELKGVTVCNKGAHIPGAEWCWKGNYALRESLEIIIHGNGEFAAENVTFNGAHRIEVDDGCRVTAFEKDGELELSVEPLHNSSWEWQYEIGGDRKVHLNKIVRRGC